MLCPRRTALGVLAAAILAGCQPDSSITIPPEVVLRSIAIDSAANLVEIGSHDTLKAIAVTIAGDTVPVPVAWRSTNEAVARFDRGGVLVALDTGATVVFASSLGVASKPITIGVVWFGAAAIDTAGSWQPPSALNAGATLTDSVRVIVTNPFGGPVGKAHVKFTVTAGTGSISPTSDSTNVFGVVAAQWTLGPDTGANTVTAVVTRADGTPDTLVKDNLITFTVRGYNALSVAAGDAQTGQILSALPTTPSVTLVDSTGASRPGVLVTFTAYDGGRVSKSVVATKANGSASPGAWTLGDLTGQQRLEARVADARVMLTATATGTPILYQPDSVIAGGTATCAIEALGVVKCWGKSPQNGADTTNVSQPVPTTGAFAAASITGGATHFCGLDTSHAIWCWGANAVVDSAGHLLPASHPSQLASAQSWVQVSPGGGHTCAVTLTSVAYCWGADDFGQLGNDSLATRSDPTPVTGGFAFTQIASGDSHTCALTSAGAAFCWGDNSVGELGDGTTGSRTSPVAVVGGHTFTSIGAGERMTCALGDDAHAYCWGVVAGLVRATPTDEGASPTFVSITVGSVHACGLTSDGSAYCWGDNASGQLGDSTTTSRPTPTRVAGPFIFTQLSAGHLHTCGITTEIAVACWGRNDAGELGETPPTIRTAPRHVVIGVNP